MRLSILFNYNQYILENLNMIVENISTQYGVRQWKNTKKCEELFIQLAKRFFEKIKGCLMNIIGKDILKVVTLWGHDNTCCNQSECKITINTHKELYKHNICKRQEW